MAVTFDQAINAATAGGVATALTTAGITTVNTGLLALGVHVLSTAQTISSVTDSLNNTWIAGPTRTVTGSGQGIIYGFYAPNITGGASQTVKVQLTGGGANMSLVLCAFTGCALTSALDQTATWNNTGFFTDHPHTAADFNGTASVTTGFAGEAVFAFNASNGATTADTFTAGSGWTIPTNGQNPGNGSSYSPSMAQYQVNVAAGTYTDNYTTGNFVLGTGLIMSFKAAASAGGGAGLMLSLLGVG